MLVTLLALIIAHLLFMPCGPKEKGETGRAADLPRFFHHNLSVPEKQKAGAPVVPEAGSGIAAYPQKHNEPGPVTGDQPRNKPSLVYAVPPPNENIARIPGKSSKLQAYSCQSAPGHSPGTGTAADFCRLQGFR